MREGSSDPLKSQVHMVGASPATGLGEEAALEQWLGRGPVGGAVGPLDHGKSKRVPEKHLFLLY